MCRPPIAGIPASVVVGVQPKLAGPKPVVPPRPREQPAPGGVERERTVDVLEERPAERGLITERAGDVLRRGPAGCGSKPNEQTDQGKHDAHRIPLTSR